jgi:tetratricopeptide (TPR) repeat protein
MQETLKIFEDEIQNLLKEYFVEDDFKRLIFDSSHSLPNDDISAKISDLYKKQLDIKIEESSERLQIDRTITFAEKKLESEKFFDFILELGTVCNNSGKLNLAQEIFNKVNRRTSDKNVKAKSLIGLADVCSRRANWTRSISLVTEAESIYKETNNKAGIANCFNLLGSISGEMGDIERAKTYFSQSLVFANESSEKQLNAKIETNLGVINSILGNTDEAVEHLESALIIYKETNDLKRVAESYLNIGLNFLQSDNRKSAIAAFDKGIEISLDNQFISVLAVLYIAKSQLLIAQKEIIAAKEFADKALSLSHVLDDKLSIAEIYKVRGIIAREMNDSQTAESYLMISLRINTKQRSNLGIAETSAEIAALYSDQGKYELSNNYYLQALDFYRKSNAKDKVMKIEKLIRSVSTQLDTAEVHNEQ